jgi:TonB-linked SusC/RagA family outer membrane protein
LVFAGLLAYFRRVIKMHHHCCLPAVRFPLFFYLKTKIQITMRKTKRLHPCGKCMGLFKMCFVLSLLLFGRAFAQTVSGIVKSAEGALAGASVVVKGTTTATTTGNNGNFSINAPQKATLVISFAGYETQEVKLTGSSSITVLLQQSDKQLGDVVVIGYGTQKRRDLTGAVSTLSASAYKDQPVLNAASALQGRVAGVAVTNTSGAPGGGVKIRIRGANSVNGSNSPLYVVDGIALSSTGLQDININDIESMEVLKDASATAVYGSRGANGVIIITTKSGKSGAAKIDYNGFVSLNKPMKQYDLMDAVTYAKTANVVAGATVFANPESFAGKGTDWQSKMFDNALTQSHQLSLASGTDKAKYYVSGFYINQQGLLINSSQQRFGLRSNIDVKINNKLSFGLGMYLARNNSRNTGDIGGKGNPVMAALTWAPTEQVYDDAENTQYNRNGVSPIWVNPYMTIRERNGAGFTNIGVFNGKMRYAITDWLSLTVNAGLDMYNSKGAYLNNNWISPGNMGAGQSSSDGYTFQNSNVLAYHQVFHKHDLSATAVLENLATKNSNFSASGSGLSSTSNEYYNLGLNASQGISSGYSNSSLLSYMGRIAYAFDNKYLLTATVRRDGSSKFQGTNNKWGTFPSASIGWKLSEESFIKDLNVFSTLKIRAGWGMTGSQAIGSYSTLGLLSTILYSYGTRTLYQGYTLGNPPTPDVKWETSKQTDIGLDIGFFGNRLNLTADYYNKRTEDLLLYTRIQNYDGGGSLLKNIGSVSNKGVELMLDAAIVKGKNFNWNSSFNIAFNKNKVLSLGADSILFRGIIGSGLINTNIQAIKVGQPMGAFYLIPWNGIYQADNKDMNFSAGDNNYTDVSGNKSIGYEDRVIVGNATPKYTWGFNNNFLYKNLELNIFIQGSQGASVFNATYAATANPTSDVYYPTLADAANYWTPENTSAPWANPASKTSRRYIESTQFLQDGSYARLKNISLSYTLPKTLLKSFSAQLYISGQNLATITKYKGYDPEATSTSSASDADGGIDLGAYPSPKTFTAGIRLGF